MSGEDRMANMSMPFAMTIAAITIALSGGHAEAQSVARIEIQPIQTVTLKTQQILTGDTKGTPATLAGELRIPKPGSDRLPAVILIHGIADDYFSIAPCRGYVERLKRAGANVVLTEYPDAYHAYDVVDNYPPIQRTDIRTAHNCLFREGDNGQFLNAKTNAIFTPNDPCFEFNGPHIAFNQAAYQATV